MKSIMLIFFLCLSVSVIFSQDESYNKIWKPKFAELLTNDFSEEQIFTSEGKLLQVIPTGKRKQSYVFVFGIFEENKSLSTLDAETISLSSKKYSVVEFEVYADDGGDNLLEFLKCNTDIPDMFVDEQTKEIYNTPEKQPCIGKFVKLKAAIKTIDDKKFFHLLEVENN